MEEIRYYTFLPNTIDYHEFLSFLEETDNLIEPRLSSRVNLEDYADLYGIMEKYHAMVVQEIKEEARLRSLKEEAI